MSHMARLPACLPELMSGRKQLALVTPRSSISGSGIGASEHGNTGTNAKFAVERTAACSNAAAEAPRWK